jgi:hypothetical protein
VQALFHTCFGTDYLFCLKMRANNILINLGCITGPQDS